MIGARISCGPLCGRKGRAASRWALRYVGYAALLLLVGCQGLVRLGRHRPPPGRMIVVHVGLLGESGVSESDIVAGLETYADNFGSFDNKPLLDISRLDQDARRVESVYAAYGYFEARCLGHKVEPVDDVSVRVFFTVREGKPTRVTEVTVAGGEATTAGDDAEAAARLTRFGRDVDDLVELDVGDVWTEAAFQRTRDALRRRLRSVGFIYAEVIGSNQVDRLKRSAVVHFEVIPGPLPRVADIAVIGSAGVEPDRVRRRVDLVRGEAVDPARFEKIEGRLFDLGVFLSVSVRAERRSLESMLGDKPVTVENVRAIDWPRETNILVTVQEQPFQEFRVGAGVAFDNAKNEVSVPIEYRNRSLFGGERHFETTLRPSYVVRPSFTQPDIHGPGFSATLGFEQPAFLEEYLLLGLRTSYNLELRDRGYYHELSGVVSLSRTFFDLLTPSLSYRADYSESFDSQSGSIIDLSRYVLTYLEQGLTLDWRDNLLDTRNGVYARASVAESFAALGSGFDFLRMEGDLRLYWRAVSWLTLAARASYSHNISFGATYPPTSVWFTGGGAADMRGYASLSMGPITCRLDDEGNEVLVEDGGSCPDGTQSEFRDGGNVKFLSSLEARVYLPFDLGLVAFADVGQIWTLPELVDWNQLAVAVGGGLRYYTIIGAIRFDVGYLVHPLGAHDPAYHVSIGQSF